MAMLTDSAGDRFTIRMSTQMPSGIKNSLCKDVLGLAPEQVLHVGDDPALDVLGALGAGMQAVWVNRDGKPWAHDAQPHATVTHLGELCAMLAGAQGLKAP